MLTFVCFFIPSTTNMVYAEDGQERESQEYDESRFDLMTYADNSWYEWADKTGTSAVSAIKNFLWQINVVIANITLMIVYQLFSLDIVELTRDSVMAIASGTAASLITNLGMFAFAIACIGIVIRAYVQQNWQAFFKIVTIIILSMAMLFSISSEKFNYVDIAHGISVAVENAVMQVNPSLTDATDFDVSHGSVGEDVSVQVENKAYQSLLYKPYLLLQYGTTNEDDINAEGSLNGDETRIAEYLNANPTTEDGMELREEISEREYDILENQNIFTGNAFKISAYIMGATLSTIIQAVVFFFLALMRIMLQFAFIFLLILAPFMLFISIFPTFEGLVGQYLKGTFMLILFKGGTMFLVLIATSFIALSYDMADMSNDIYYRIFIQSIFSISIIFMYMKRQFVFDMLNGSNLSLTGMGAGEGMGRQSMNRFRKGANTTKNIGKRTAAGTKKTGKVASRTIGKAGAIASGVNKKTSNMYDQAGRSVSAKGMSMKDRVGEKMNQAKDYVKKSQLGEVGPKESPYHTQEQDRTQSTTNVSNINEERTRDKQQSHTKQQSIGQKGRQDNGATPNNARSKGNSYRDPRVAQQNLKDSSKNRKDKSNKTVKDAGVNSNQAKYKSKKNQQQTSPKRDQGRSPKRQSHDSGTKTNNQSVSSNVNSSTGRNPYATRENVQRTERANRENKSIQSNQGGMLHQRSLLHGDDNNNERI